MAAATACGAPQTAPTKQSDTLNIVFPEGLGTAGGTGTSQTAASLTTEGLTQFAIDGRVNERLAKQWNWSDDGLQLNVLLRPGVLMHDGTKLDAPRVAKLLLALTQNPEAGKNFPSLTLIKSVVVKNPLEIVITLTRHSSWLPEDLSTGLSEEKEGQNLVATGPYRVVRTDGSNYELERFDRYYGGPAAIPRVAIKPVATLRVAWASLLRGEVDMVTDVPPDTIDLIRNDNVQIVSFPRRYQYMIAFNSRLPKFKDPRVRRALNLAIDRESIVRNVLKGAGVAASGPVWPRHWAYDPAVGSFRYDSDGAMALLNSAGFAEKPSPDTATPPARLRLRCLIPSKFSIYEQVASEVQRQLSDVGVDITFDVQEYGVYSDRLRAGDFEVILVDIASGPGMSRASIFWRGQGKKGAYRIFGYDNPRTEQLFDVLDGATSDAEIRATTPLLQQEFLNNPPAIFIAWNERARAVSSRFRVVARPEFDPLPTLWQWRRADASPSLASR